jgi:hypothetical protein
LDQARRSRNKRLAFGGPFFDVYMLRTLLNK